MLKRALHKDEAFLRDVREHNDTGDGFRLWWLGQSGFLLKWRGLQLLLDPYLSDALTKKYAETDKPHVRMTERVVDPARLEGIEVVTSSHNHTDHLDPETLIPLRQKNPNYKLVLPAANVRFAKERLGEAAPEFVGLDHGKVAQAGGFSFTGVAASHNEVEFDEEGRCRFLGFVVDFGPWTIFHAGDTLWHDGLVEALVFHRPHLMILPINGSRPERRVAGNLNGAEAAALAKACGARCAIPCHYDMFTFNTESPDLFVMMCHYLAQRYRVLQHGEAFSSEELTLPD